MQKEKLFIKTLFENYPHLIAEWDENVNLSLTTNHIKTTSTKSAWWKCPKGHSWRARIVDRTRSNPLNCPVCIVGEIKLKKLVNKTSSKQLNLKKIEKSLAARYPKIAKEWHPTKNDKITPKDVSYSSHKEVWWQCKRNKEHSWKTRVQTRTYSNAGCPYCIRNVNPEIFSQGLSVHLLKEWDFSKNGEPFFKDIRSIPTKKVGWKCKNEHEWEESIYRRYKLKTKCPHCVSYKKSVPLHYPFLLNEWDYEKNDALNIIPNNVSIGSQKKIWWKCKNGHSWQCTIVNRMQTRKKSNCPKCRSLSFQHPEIAMEWHPTKNRSLTPDIIYSGSAKKVWWKCKKGHNLYSSINYRVKQNGCPICNTIKTSNTLAIKYPDIAEEWHPTLNGALTPNDVLPKSNKYAWWQCANGHSWKCIIYARLKINGKKSSCPDCKYDPSHGKTLGMNFPQLALEWHPTMNGDLTPNKVTISSAKKVWWICTKNISHIWEARIYHRTRANSGCPYCSNNKVCHDNCLSTLYPSIASEWHPTKNKLQPNQVVFGSHKKVWWLCNQGHEWGAAINYRTKYQRKCRKCMLLE